MSSSWESLSMQTYGLGILDAMLRQEAFPSINPQSAQQARQPSPHFASAGLSNYYGNLPNIYTNYTSVDGWQAAIAERWEEEARQLAALHDAAEHVVWGRPMWAEQLDSPDPEELMARHGETTEY